MDFEQSVQIRSTPTENITLSRRFLPEAVWICRNLQKEFQKKTNCSLDVSDLSLIAGITLVVFILTDVVWSLLNRAREEVCLLSFNQCCMKNSFHP